MTVFLVHPVRDNISDAARFGSLETINLGYVFGDQINDGEIPEPIQFNLQGALLRFNPMIDYLLIVGDHLQLALMTALLGRKFKEFQVLRWERQANAYMPVRIQT